MANYHNCKIVVVILSNILSPSPLTSYRSQDNTPWWKEKVLRVSPNLKVSLIHTKLKNLLLKNILKEGSNMQFRPYFKDFTYNFILFRTSYTRINKYSYFCLSQDLCHMYIQTLYMSDSLKKLLSHSRVHYNPPRNRCLARLGQLKFHLRRHRFATFHQEHIVEGFTLGGDRCG